MAAASAGRLAWACPALLWAWVLQFICRLVLCITHPLPLRTMRLPLLCITHHHLLCTALRPSWWCPDPFTTVVATDMAIDTDIVTTTITIVDG